MRGTRVTKETIPVISNNLQKTVLGKTLFLFNVTTRSLKKANQALHAMRSDSEIPYLAISQRKTHYLAKVFTKKQFDEDFFDDERPHPNIHKDPEDRIYPLEKGTELIIGRFTRIEININDKISVKPHGIFIEQPREKDKPKSPKQILVIYW